MKDEIENCLGCLSVCVTPTGACVAPRGPGLDTPPGRARVKEWREAEGRGEGGGSEGESVRETGEGVGDLNEDLILLVRTVLASSALSRDINSLTSADSTFFFI